MLRRFTCRSQSHAYRTHSSSLTLHHVHTCTSCTYNVFLHTTIAYDRSCIAAAALRAHHVCACMYMMCTHDGTLCVRNKYNKLNIALFMPIAPWSDIRCVLYMYICSTTQISDSSMYCSYLC